ncbi:MAG: hypothetical protein J7M25_17875 [Deltaproteobacteria bacterium]|nr:hypothetical protein [Deltaproteobacteria bacterium]
MTLAERTDTRRFKSQRGLLAAFRIGLKRPFRKSGTRRSTNQRRTLWFARLTFLLFFALLLSCDRQNDGAAAHVPRGVALTSHQEKGGDEERIPKQKVPIRPPCAKRFTRIIRPNDIQHFCNSTKRPIPFASDISCRYLYPKGTVLLMEHPAYAELRRAFPHAPTIQTARGWAFSFQARNGARSIVIRKRNGSALILQAPQSLCSTTQLRRLALLAADRLTAARPSPR